MTPVIRIDDQVMAKLKELAKELDMVFESPNAILRVKLGLDSPDTYHQQASKGIRTCKYASEARGRYDQRLTDVEEFIGDVWRGIKENAGGHHMFERATKALLELLEESGGQPVRGALILERAGIDPSQTASNGMWPWLGANVVRLEKDAAGKRCYSIPEDELHTALLKVVLGREGR